MRKTENRPQPGKMIFLIGLVVLFLSGRNLLAFSIDQNIAVELSSYEITGGSLSGSGGPDEWQTELSYQLSSFFPLRDDLAANLGFSLFLQEGKVDYYLDQAYLACHFGGANTLELGKNTFSFGNSLTENVLHYNEYQYWKGNRLKTNYWMVNARFHSGDAGLGLISIPAGWNLDHELKQDGMFVMFAYNSRNGDYRVLQKLDNDEPFLAVSISRAFAGPGNLVAYLDTKVISYDTGFSLAKDDYSGYYHIKETPCVKKKFAPLLFGVNWNMFGAAFCRVEYITSDYSLAKDEQELFWELLASGNAFYTQYGRKNIFSDQYINIGAIFLQLFPRTDLVFNLKYNVRDQSSQARLAATLHINRFVLETVMAKTFFTSRWSEFGIYPFAHEFTVRLQAYF